MGITRKIPKDNLDEAKNLEKEPIIEPPLGYTLEEQRRDEARAQASGGTTLNKIERQPNSIRWKPIATGFAVMLAILCVFIRLGSQSPDTDSWGDHGHNTLDSEAPNAQEHQKRTGDMIPITSPQSGTGPKIRWQSDSEWFRIGVKLLWLRETGEILRSTYLSGRAEITNESTLWIKGGMVAIQVFRAGHWWLTDGLFDFRELAPGATQECEFILKPDMGELRLQDIDSWAVRTFNIGTTRAQDEIRGEKTVILMAIPIGLYKRN